jgi:predicted Zn-dependent peptidase
MIFIKTIVGASRVKSVEKMIAQEIEKSVYSFDAEDLARAQNAIINGLVEHAASNQQLALSFLFLRRYGFGPDYFDTRAQALSCLSVEQVRDSVRSVVSTDSLAAIRIGRV